MKRRLKILSDDLKEWFNQDYPDLNHNYIFKKKSYNKIQMHSFNDMIINRKLLWNFGRDINELFDDLLDIEKMTNNQLSNFRYFIRSSNTIIWKIIRKITKTKYHKTLSNYTSRFEQKTDLLFIEKGICFIHSGDDHCWPHFMQDTSHLIINTIDFLKKNEDVKILFFNHRIHIEPFIRDICKIKNEIKYMLNETIRVGELFIPTYMPQSIFYDKIVPSKYLIPVRKLCQNICANSNEKYLVYQTRKNVERRRILNENEIIDTLKQYSNKNNLKFVEFVHSDFNFFDRFNLYYNSNVVVAPHGGASYHMFACKPNTKFIEFVVEGSCGLFAPSLVDYHVIIAEKPFKGSGYHKDYHVNPEKLIRVLNNQTLIDLYKN